MSTAPTLADEYEALQKEFSAQALNDLTAFLNSLSVPPLPPSVSARSGGGPSTPPTAAQIMASGVGIGALDGSTIIDDTITGDQVGDDEIDTQHIVPGAVGSTELDDLAVTTAKLAADAVTLAKLHDDAVSTAKLVDGAVEAVKLADRAVETVKIAVDALAFEHFPDTIRPVTVQTSATLSELVNESGAQLVNESGYILMANVPASLPALPDPDYPLGAVIYTPSDEKLYRNVNDQWAKWVDGGDILANSITARQIAARTITTVELAAFAVTAVNIAANSIVADHIVAGSITTGKIAAGAITTATLAATATIAYVSSTGSNVIINDDGLAIYNGKLYLVDASGYVVLSGSSGFDNAWADFIQTGLYNSDFGNGPLAGIGTVLASNNMPYWRGPTLVVGAPVITWTVDPPSPSGYSIQAVMPGTASEEWYIEQIVPIPADRSGAGGVAPRAIFYSSGLTAGELTGKIAVQFLLADQVTTIGSTITITTILSTTAGTTTVSAVDSAAAALSIAPSTAAYARIRVGAYRHATLGVGSSDTIWLSNIRLDPVHTIYLVGDSTGAHAPGSLTQESTGMVLRPGGTTTAYWSLGYNGEVTTRGAYIHGGISYGTLDADKNNWAPTGLATCTLLEADLSVAPGKYISGFSATGFTNGQRFTIYAAHGWLGLYHNSGSSTSGNRIFCPGATDYILDEGCAVDIIYYTYPSDGAPFRVVGHT